MSPPILVRKAALDYKFSIRRIHDRPSDEARTTSSFPRLRFRRRTWRLCDEDRLFNSLILRTGDVDGIVTIGIAIMSKELDDSNRRAVIDLHSRMVSGPRAMESVAETKRLRVKPL